MAIFAVQWPADCLIQSLKRGLGLLRNVAHDRVDGLALVIPLLALDDILRRHSSLRKIDIAWGRRQSGRRFSHAVARLTLLLVDTQNHDDLIATNTDELLDTSNTSSRQFGEEDHSVNIVVFQQLHICAHLGNLDFCSPSQHSPSSPDNMQHCIPASHSPSHSCPPQDISPRKNGSWSTTSWRVCAFPRRTVGQLANENFWTDEVKLSLR